MDFKIHHRDIISCFPFSLFLFFFVLFSSFSLLDYILNQTIIFVTFSSGSFSNIEWSSSINFKIGDIDNMQSKIKSGLNQDAFEKPQEEVLYRKKEDGGLNLTNIKLKMKA